MMVFATKVKFVREQLKISQEELARALIVSYATVNRWEASRTKPNRIAKNAFYDFCERNGVHVDRDDTLK